MSRGLLGVLLATLMVLTVFGSAGAGPRPVQTVTLSGRLAYVADISSAHYEVADYVLFYKDSELLAQLVGHDVLVTGTLSATPSILMKQALDVQHITVISRDNGEIIIQPWPAPSSPSGGDNSGIIIQPWPAPSSPSGGDNSGIIIQPWPAPSGGMPGPIRIMPHW